MGCSLLFDEFPSIYSNNIDSLIATKGCNQIATTLTMHNLSLLTEGCGKEQRI